MITALIHGRFGIEGKTHGKSPTVATLWQRRYVPFNVFTHKKHMQMLDDMHNNPVTAKLIPSPDRWIGSSFRCYYFNDSSVLTMDRVR
jgi:hypothetical protein